MPEPGGAARPGKGRNRPSPASLGVVRVGADFADEFPGGDASCTEAYATLVRTGEALMAEIDRCIRVTFGLPHAALTALAVIEGAGEPVTTLAAGEQAPANDSEDGQLRRARGQRAE